MTDIETEIQAHSLTAPRITLRTYLAGQALMAYNANPTAAENSQQPDAIAKWCYRVADAMLNEAEK